MSNGNGTWMPLYIGDYLGDTMELDGAQHGAYLLLLMYYWRNGPLPTEDAKLAQIARTDLRLWKKIVGPVVKAFFHEKDGRLHQKRADQELAKAEEISSKRRAAAEARWNCHSHPTDHHANASRLHGTCSQDADANASDLHGVCSPDADAKGMLRARASPSPSPSPVQTGSEAAASDSAVGAVHGPRQQVFSEGLTILRSLTGLSDRQARAFLGKLLSLCGDDCPRVFNALWGAGQARPADPTAWLIATLSPKKRWVNPWLDPKNFENLPDPFGHHDRREIIHAH